MSEESNVHNSSSAAMSGSLPPPTTRRYWAMRTSRDNEAVRKLLHENIHQGILRQGWGYHESQDLKLTEAKLKSGGSLTSDEYVSWRGNRKILSSQEGINIGDIILLMNQPENGYLYIIEVTGDYSYSPIKLTNEQDHWELKQDFGHCLPIQSVNGFYPILLQDEDFSASLRRSFTCQSRMWCLDDHAKNIEVIIKRTIGSSKPSQQNDSKSVFDKISMSAYVNAKKSVQEEIHNSLKEKIVSSELEIPCKIALESFFPSPYFQIEHRGGPAEMGADIIVTWNDPFENFNFSRSPTELSKQVTGCYVIQVKDWDNTADDTKPIDQIKQAKSHYESGAPVRAGYIFTLCDSESEKFQKHRIEVEKEIGIPIFFVGKTDLLNILTEYAMTKFSATRGYE